MGKDFYHFLGINRDASLADIQKAYRTLSLKNHPTRVSTDESKKHFYRVAEAYHVLSNAKWKAVYDQFGEEGLQSGVPTTEEGGFSGVYQFHGNAETVFEDFFGGNNPFSELFGFGISGDLKEAPEFGGQFGRARPKQGDDQQKILQLSLEEAYRGCLKKLKVSKTVVNDDRRTTSIRSKTLTVNVPPGTPEGTTFRFRKEGDQEVNNIPADLVIVVEDKLHDRFCRVGPDLYYKHRLELWEALCGVWIELKTLDERMITIPINDIISPGYKKVVQGEGMPLLTDPSKKGNLILTFEIKFPQKLSPRQKEALQLTLRN